MAARARTRKNGSGVQDKRLSVGEMVQQDLAKQGKAVSDPAYQELYSAGFAKAQKEADAEIKSAKESGMWPHRKDKEMKGLRNRRRIHGDIEEILRRIAALALGEREEVGACV